MSPDGIQKIGQISIDTGDDFASVARHGNVPSKKSAPPYGPISLAHIHIEYAIRANQSLYSGPDDTASDAPLPMSYRQSSFIAVLYDGRRHYANYGSCNQSRATRFRDDVRFTFTNSLSARLVTLGDPVDIIPEFPLKVFPLCRTLMFAFQL